MATILITGVAGFAGSHLADLLLQDSTTQIAGILHPKHEIRYLQGHPRLKIYQQDILDFSSLKKTLRTIQPDEVYHLAGWANVHESWKDRKATVETNFIGALHLLEACRALSVFPRVLLIGSAECYGNVPENEQPIEESHPLVPSSPYAVSKIAQEMLGLQYARAEKLPVYLSRSFNHTGPRQKETFVCAAFARQVAEAQLHPGIGEIKVGNLAARRDFSDVRDVVRAYCSILRNGNPGEPYNICSGSAVSIQEVLDIVLTFTDRKPKIIVDPERFRPVELPLLLGSARKLQTQTGWSPQYDIRDTLRDLFEYWLSELKKVEQKA
jgi:GDP-4-dehydro-6-deoxy-D-mannose reductase